MDNEKRATKLIAKLLGQIITTRPRQQLAKFTVEDTAQFSADVDALVAKEESRKAIDAKACDRMLGSDDLRKGYATGETDPSKVMAKVHQSGRPILGNSTAATDHRLSGVIPEGKLDPRMAKVMSDRFQKDANTTGEKQ